MANNKIIYNNQVLIDLTSDTAVAEDVAQGKTFHLADGTQATGTASGGGVSGPVVEKDVNFIDYDGTIVYSYTADEFLELTTLPDNPTHTGLTAQGWNWTLSEAKTYVQTCGILVIGQNYITDNEHTRIFITLDKNQLTILLGIGLNGTATVNWGDGNSENIQGSSLDSVLFTSHSYGSIGDYVIDIGLDSNSSLNILGKNNSSSLIIKKNANTYENDSYRNTITKIELGKNVNLGMYSFHNLKSLISITMPNYITFIFTSYTFMNCVSLLGIVLPRTATKTGYYHFYQCSSMNYISIPPTFTYLESFTFQNSGIRMITLKNVANIYDGVFSSCYRLQKISINSNSYIGGNLFSNCLSLQKIDLSRSTFTNLNQGFSANNNLIKKVKLPSSITQFGGTVFYNCYSLNSIEIPSGVTTIGSNAFGNCYGLTEIHFKPTTPPTVSYSNAFSNLPTNCKIYVPSGSLSAYTSATNYPSSSTYTYIEE